MKYFYDAIKLNVLWKGIGYDDFIKIFNCIGTKAQKYTKGETIIHSGDPVENIGLIISGRVRLINGDMYGKQSILAELAVPDIFGETYAYCGAGESSVDILAADDCVILFINHKKIITPCQSACAFHSKLIGNMLEILAKKTLALNRKIEILSKRTTRDKLLAFFNTQRGLEKKFTIPYNREELAHYLCVDRSAMSGELCRMRDEGLIKFDKNKFEIL